LAKRGGRRLEQRRIAMQTAEPGAVVRLVAERLPIDDLHEVERDAAVQLDEDEVLVEGLREPLERVARPPGEQSGRQFLARPELRRGNGLELLQDPAGMRALPLAMLGAERDL